ncbi:Transferase [Penicillium cataractarum]|uniref:Transferase n=1 Tax=Penicillium cataractarum TaxID=2100454 RepID=A0A9W9VT84_9EURO|nr:Transferase [Penicillium cataractarum]KAJ5388992.1 Transferase [Penicillium cataractarum]
MMRLFYNPQSRGRGPKTVPTDDIIPLRFWDTALCMRGTVIDISLKFDDCLDISKIRAALDELFKLDNWKQVGARLREHVCDLLFAFVGLNRIRTDFISPPQNGKLEYHIPQSFDSSRPAYHFTNVEHSMNIGDHPLGKKLPQASDKPMVYGSPDEFTPLVCGVDSPTSLDDWIHSDRPQFSIHTVSFNDSTIITVTWIHTLADVMGLKIFLDAWTAMLRGDPTAVPKLEDFRSDPLSLLGQRTPANKYHYYDRVFARKDFFWFIGMNILERLWYRQEERRTICLPAASLKHLRSRAMDQISAISPTDKESAPFVSESDVLLAWWVSTVHSALALRPDQVILVNNALNLRTSTHDAFETSEDMYMGNALCMSPTFLSGRQISEESLGQIALRIRESLVQQRTTEQVEAMTALQMETMETTGYLALVGDPRMLLLSCSNWNKARLYDMDFSSAVVRKSPSADIDRLRAPGKPTYVNGVQHSANSFRNVLSVKGKDSAGNWWLTGVLRTNAWKRVQAQLDMIDTI